MKNLAMIIMTIFLIGCDNVDNLVEIDRDFEGEYFDGEGTIDGEEILFLFVSEFPADRSLFVQFTTPTNVHACRYFYFDRVDNVNSYVSDPLDLSVIELKIDRRIDISFYSEGETEEDPCKKINSTMAFRLVR